MVLVKVSWVRRWVVVMSRGNMVRFRRREKAPGVGFSFLVVVEGEGAVEEGVGEVRE